MDDLAARVKEARDTMTFSAKQNSNKRGHFPSVSVGTSFGGGSKVRFLGTAFTAVDC